MNIPEDLKYTKEHEWIRVDGNRATVGITDFAQDTLGDIVYIELPEVDTEVAVQDEVTTIESVKSAEPIYAPLTGKIVEVNEGLNDTPELINTKPYESAIFVLEITDLGELSTLLDHAGYAAVVAESQKED